MAKGLRPFDSDRPVRIHQSRLLCALQTFGKASDPLIILTPRREDVRLLRRELTPFYPDQAMRELYPLGLIHGEIDTRNEEVMAERAAALEMILKKKPPSSLSRQKLPSRNCQG